MTATDGVSVEGAIPWLRILAEGVVMLGSILV